MATSQMSEVILHLRRRVLLRKGAGLTDGQLLEDYISRRDEAALAALVRRHGPMVWGVCRRVLRSYHDAEDAFQATFLVLVRKAASIASKELLANWLYGVARQTALKARATTAKRRTRERQVAEMPEPAVAEQDLWRDLQPLLDEELSRLPDKYRSVVVLCDLEGKTRKGAAQQLGCPEGTVAGRLARARVMLAERLAQRGIALSGGALAAVLSQNVASAGVPTSVVSSTIKAATLFAAGQAAATGLISVKVAALAQGVLKTMLLSKLKVATALLLALSIVTSGGGLLTYDTVAAHPTTADKEVADVTKVQQSDAPQRFGDEEKEQQAVADPGKGHPKKDTDTKMFPEGLRHDFGKVPRGKLAEHSFPIINNSDGPLRFVSVRVSAGCLNASVSKDSLQQNDNGELKITLDPKRFVGPKDFRIYLMTASGGVQKEFEVSVSADSQDGYIGLLEVRVDPAGKGVYVKVVPDGPADKAGIKADDLITKIDGKEVKEFDGFVQAIRDHKPGDNATLTVVRDGKEMELQVTIGERPAQES